MTFSKLSNVYYGTSEHGFDENQIPRLNDEKMIDNMVLVCGGMFALNLVASKPAKRIHFIDINPYAIQYAKIFTDTIKKCEDVDAFFRTLSLEYPKGTTADAVIRKGLYAIGYTYFNGGWDDIDFTGQKRTHPKESIPYAFDNYTKMRGNLLNAEVSFSQMDITSPGFRKLIDKPSTWVFLSNIIHLGYSRRNKTPFPDITYEFTNPENVTVFDGRKFRVMDLHGSDSPATLTFLYDKKRPKRRPKYLVNFSKETL